MMKKYISPEVFTETVLTLEMISVSTPDSIKSSGLDDDMTYGGVDENGTLNPASRRGTLEWDKWDDEQDEYY